MSHTLTKIPLNYAHPLRRVDYRIELVFWIAMTASLLFTARVVEYLWIRFRGGYRPDRVWYELFAIAVVVHIAVLVALRSARIITLGPSVRRATASGAGLGLCFTFSHFPLMDAILVVLNCWSGVR